MTRKIYVVKCHNKASANIYIFVHEMDKRILQDKTKEKADHAKCGCRRRKMRLQREEKHLQFVFKMYNVSE